MTRPLVAACSTSTSAPRLEAGAHLRRAQAEIEAGRAGRVRCWHREGLRRPTAAAGRVAAVLGLPDGIRACLFDMDGVLTETATVHAAAWKEMFDDYLQRARRRRASGRSPQRRLRRVRGRQAALRRRPVVPRLARHRPARGLARRRPAGAETVHGLGNRKNDLVLEMIHDEGVEPYPGSVTLRQRRARGRPAHRRRLLERATPARCSRPPASRDLFETRRRRARRRGRRAQGQAGARHLPRRRAAELGVERGRGRGVRGRARRASRPAAPGSFGYVVGVDRVGQADALARARRRRGGRGPGRAARCDRRTTPIPTEPWARARDRARPRLPGPVASRSSRSPTGTWACAATSTRASRARSAAPTSTASTSRYPLSYGERGYGYPEDGQTVVNVTDGKLIRLLVEDEPLDVHRGTSHQPRARARLPRRHADALGALDIGGAASGPGDDAAGSCPSAARSRRRHLLRGRGGRPAAARRPALEPARQPARPARPATTRAAASGARAARWRASSRSTTTCASCSRTGRSAAGSRWRRAWSTWSTIENPTALTQSEPDLGRVTISAQLEPGQPLRVVKLLAYHWSSQQSIEWLRDQVDASLENAVAEGWDGLARSQREYLDDYWAAPTSSSTATPRSSRRCASRCSTSSRPRRAPRRGRSRPRA